MKNFNNKNRKKPFKKKKEKNNPFWNTIHEIRTMTNNFTNEKEKKFFNEKIGGIKKKGPKMPINMLSGIRKKIINEYQKSKEENQNENIQYKSNDKLIDTNFLQRKINAKKLKNQDFLKNKYKYKDLKSTGFGSFKGGMLTLSKRDIEKVNQQ